MAEVCRSTHTAAATYRGMQQGQLPTEDEGTNPGFPVLETSRVHRVPFTVLSPCREPASAPYAPTGRVTGSCKHSKSGSHQPYTL